MKQKKKLQAKKYNKITFRCVEMKVRDFKDDLTSLGKEWDLCQFWKWVLYQEEKRMKLTWTNQMTS